MARWLALSFVVIGFLVACKKNAEPEPEPEVPSKAGTSGHSVTKIKEPEEHAGSSAGSDEDLAARGAAKAKDSEKEKALHERQLYGGDGSPAYRDDDGHLHGPGGPVFMGKGPDCTDKIDHCLRAGVWFAVPTLRTGNIYRATPAFEFESKWWTFREREAEFEQLLKTKVIEKAGELVVGSPVVFIVDDNYRKWLDNEHDALTSSRWEAGIIEAVNGDSTFRVSGWRYAIPNETGRIVVEKKGS